MHQTICNIFSFVYAYIRIELINLYVRSRTRARVAHWRRRFCCRRRRANERTYEQTSGRQPTHTNTATHMQARQQLSSCMLKLVITSNKLLYWPDGLCERDRAGGTRSNVGCVCVCGVALHCIALHVEPSRGKSFTNPIAYAHCVVHVHHHHYRCAS